MLRVLKENHTILVVAIGLKQIYKFLLFFPDLLIQDITSQLDPFFQSVQSETEHLLLAEHQYLLALQALFVPA